MLGSVTVTADGSSQKCEAQKNADLVLQTICRRKNLTFSYSHPSGRCLDEASASTIGTIWNFWKNRRSDRPVQPVHDKHLPDDLDGLLLGGGYPELYAKALEENETIRNEIRRKAEEDMPFWQSAAVSLSLKELEDEMEPAMRWQVYFPGKATKKEKILISAILRYRQKRTVCI